MDEQVVLEAVKDWMRVDTSGSPMVHSQLHVDERAAMSGYSRSGYCGEHLEKMKGLWGCA